MADPKYADLPGIAYDQPDSYETSDLPESDQNNDYFEEETDSIERLHISVGDAFNKFKGKGLNSSVVDFSDRLSRARRTGYDARSGDWELVGLGEHETPLQRYQRLKCEMHELMEEVSQIKNNAKEELKEGDHEVLVTHISRAQKQLSESKLAETLGSELVTNLEDPQGVQLKKLVSQLDLLRQAEGGSSKPGSALGGAAPPGRDQGLLTYQLNHRPEQTHLTQTARMADLEQRLHRLEAVLGTSSDKMSHLTLDSSNKSLLAVAHALSAKVSLLDPSQLDQVEARLVALGREMDAIAEKGAATNPNRDGKVSELYELVKKSESLTQVLPQALQRLTTLDTLHMQAAQFSKSLTQLEELQQQIVSSLQSNESLLRDSEGRFARNLDDIKKNMCELDGRIATLAKSK